jgi:hypothetical protein
MANRLLMQDESLPQLFATGMRARRRELAQLVRRKLSPGSGAVDTVLSRVKLDFDVMAYFSDPPVNLYQIRQWLYPLERLNETHPVFILTRDTETFQTLSRETDLSVVNARRIGTIDAIAQHSDIKMAVYVNQTFRNFHAMRYPDMFHVFLSHGESEKGTYMATNQAKAYDFTFVAGDAAVDRIRTNLVRFDWEDRLVKIGRPQLDIPHDPIQHASTRTTVLYAPTWEGDRPSMSYGSVQSHGPGIVKAITSDPRFRLVYRPHPRIGVTVPAAAEVDHELRELVQAAARLDPSAEHRVDLAPHFGPQIDEADVMICDVSAVALDYLPTGKPLVVTTPTQPDATYDRSTFLGSVYELPVDKLGKLPGMLHSWVTDDTRRDERQRWVQHYFGDVSPGASMQRFLDACEMAINLRDKLVGEKRARQGSAQPG